VPGGRRFSEQQPVDVVVAEEGLDDRPGREVLAWLRDRQPAAGRILLVDSAEYPNAVTLLKEGVAQRLLRKPLDEVEWRETVDDLLRDQSPPESETDPQGDHAGQAAATGAKSANRQVDSFKEELARSGHFLALRDAILEKIPIPCWWLTSNDRSLSEPAYPGATGRPRRYVDVPHDLPLSVLLNIDLLDEAIRGVFKMQRGDLFPEVEFASRQQRPDAGPLNWNRW
jgi:hypothetical protein